MCIIKIHHLKPSIPGSNFHQIDAFFTIAYQALLYIRKWEQNAEFTIYGWYEINSFNFTVS